MMRIAKNRILDAMLKCVLLTALVHLGILAIYSIIFWDLGVFNYFSILDMGLFIPGISAGQVSMVVSTAFMASVFLAIFFFYTKSEKKKGAAKKPLLAVKTKQMAASTVISPELE